MRLQRDSVAVVILLLIFVAAGLLLGAHLNDAPRTASEELVPNPSVLNDRSSGTKALFEWVAKRGYRPIVWRRSWDHLNQNNSARLLLIIDPRIEPQYSALTGGNAGGAEKDRTILAAQDADILKRWLNGGLGRTAILFTSRLASGRSQGKSIPDETDSFGDALDVIVESANPETGREEFSPLQPTRDTAGILSLHSASGARISRKSPDAIALFGDAAGPLALEIPEGRGRLIAVADSRLVSNHNLPRSENAVFLDNLMTHYGSPGGTVLFDEYHHGDVAATEASLWDVLGRPLQLALIQAMFAAVILVGVLAIRFGPPTPLLRGMTRTSAEYVTSVASLYRRAHASGTALETLYRQFLRDLCSRLALPPDVNLEQLATVAARRGHIDPQLLRRVLAACEQRLDDQKISEAELLELTQQMERIRKDIGIA